MRSMLCVLSVSVAIVAAACSGSAPQDGSRAVAVDTPACERLAEVIANGLPVGELAAGKLDRLWVDVKARAIVIDAAPSAEIPLGAPSVGNAEPGRRTVVIAGETRATVDELRRALDREAGERDLRVTGEVRQGDPGQLVAFDVNYVHTAGHTETFSARSCSNGGSRVAVEHPVREETVGRCMEDRFAAACRAVLAELEATTSGLRRSPLDREDAITVEVLADGRVAAEHSIVTEIGGLRLAAADAIRAFTDAGWECVELTPRPELPAAAPQGACVDPAFLGSVASPITARFRKSGAVPFVGELRVSSAERSATASERWIATATPVG
jgi:hypothetical protein